MVSFVRRAAIVPAAGLGTRLNKGPKGLLRLRGRTMIEWVALTLGPIVDRIVIAVPEGSETWARQLLPECSIIGGGATRHESLLKLFARSQADTVLIQDAARPFASRTLCEKVLLAAESHGAAGAFLDPVVPVGRLSNNKVSHYWHRSEVGIFQAPQAFSHDVLAKAMQHPNANDFQSTMQLVISTRQSVYAVPGEAENIKITSTLDWEIAEKVLAPRLGR